MENQNSAKPEDRHKFQRCFMLPPMELPSMERPSRRVSLAQLKYDSHIRQFPGDYRTKEACNSDHNEAWRAWTRTKHELQAALELSMVLDTEPSPPTILGMVHAPKEHRDDIKSYEYHFQRYLDNLEILITLETYTPGWGKVRNACYNSRIKCIKRANMEGIPVPEFPPIPIPEKRQRKDADNG